MEVYITTDETIAKYVHDDGSETAIKTLPKGEISCGGSSREKFNVFASCSSGCHIQCAFCYLTSKKFVYTTLDPKIVTNNIIEAVEHELVRRPELLRIPMNLSWMGMGDAFFNISHTHINTLSILARLKKKVYAIEGVDIATTMPAFSYEYSKALNAINNALISTNKLTTKPHNRTSLRIFYSLHSLNDKIRKKLIPRTLDVDVAIKQLDNLGKQYNIIYHYMFLDGINDSNKDILALIEFGRTHNVRILRYNACPNSKFKESERFNDIIDTLNKYIDIKVQVSPGSEISAACGMFLMKYAK